MKLGKFIRILLPADFKIEERTKLMEKTPAEWAIELSPKEQFERQQRLACAELAARSPYTDGNPVEILKAAKEFYKFVEKGE